MRALHPTTPGVDITGIRAAAAALGVDARQVWLDYYALGGDAPQQTVDAWLAATARPAARDYDILATAMNEALADRGLERSIPDNRSAGTSG